MNKKCMFCRSNYGILFSLDLSFIFMQNTYNICKESLYFVFGIG